VTRNGSTGHAFISHAPEDAAAVDRLHAELESAGIPVWRDLSMLPGDDWQATIRRAITDDALVFLAGFSSRSLLSGPSRQNEEIALAIEQLRARPPGELWLIPVRFDDCRIPDWDIGGGRTLRSLRAADLFGERTRRETEQLITSIQRVLSVTGTTGPASASAEMPDPEHVRSGGAAISRDRADGGKPLWKRMMTWDAAIRAAWIGGICVIIGALIALIPWLLGGAQSGNPAVGNSPHPGSATPARTWPETTFTRSKTFADYVNAGYPLGALLKPGQVVRVSCRVRGFKVTDGDTWWYRLASPPWNGKYYATSDVFYNSPKTTGNPINGIIVDRRVPVC
jgi:hypothetical protein